MSNLIYDKEKHEFRYEEDVLAVFSQKREQEHAKPVPVNEVPDSRTVVIAADEKELGTGLGGEAVIDRKLWDKIIAAVDAQQAEEKTRKEAEERIHQAAIADSALEDVDDAVAISELFDDEQYDESDKQKKAFSFAALGLALKKLIGLSMDEDDEVEAPKEKKPKKAKKKKDKKNKGKMGIGKKIILAVLSLGFICVIAVGAYTYSIIKDTPKIDPSNIYDMLSENSILRDKDGNAVDKIYVADSLRTNVEYKDIPQYLIDALVCTEDKTFWTHKGFNIVRIFGAVWDSVKSGFAKRIGGTSTITQQLARNIYLTDTRSSRGLEGIERKIKEAYYTILLEKTLTKEQILEAYLNTVYLGANVYGVQNAAQGYFSKDVKDLGLVECAALAALPQSPTAYSPVKTIAISDVENFDDYDIIIRSDKYLTYYNSKGEDRVDLLLWNMMKQEKLSEEEYNAIDIHETLRAAINPTSEVNPTDETTSYFKDYIVSVVLQDLQDQLGYSYKDAHDLLYKGGLIINSTMDSEIQKVVDEEYADGSNFPKIGTTGMVMDKKKNILYNNESKRVMLFLKSNLFSEDGVFTLNADEFEKQANGDIKIFSGNRLNIYKTQSGGVIDYSLEFKAYYEWIDGQLYTTDGGYVLIDAEYKDRDSDGNLILKSSYFTAADEEGNLLNEGDFIFNEDGTLTISPDLYQLRATIIQPQSAYVIIENTTGKIVAMVGGRDIEGSLLYNRAINPRQTGSSIKTLSVYSSTIQKGFTNAKLNAQNGPDEYGKLLPVYTAATAIDDVPQTYQEKLWPYNVSNTFGGATWLRHAIQQSLNCCAVNLYTDVLSPEEIVDHLQNLGISSLTTTGDPNDLNASALALGGFTKGVSPLEMCAAYACIGNYGMYNSPTCYTTVTTKSGDVILEAKTESHRVLDEEVASITLDLLRSVVTEGGASAANLDCQPVAGKTGTTSNNYDLWFCGLTPKYSATVWLGSDTNLYLSGTSSRSAIKVWTSVMKRVGKMDPMGEFELRGEAGFVNVTIDTLTGLLPTEDTPEENLRTEVFIKGTEPTYSDPDARVMVRVCSHSGYLATPECEAAGCAVWRSCTRRIGGLSWEAMLASYKLAKNDIADKVEFFTIIPDSVNDVPDYYCPIHNSNPTTDGAAGGYIVSPFVGYVDFNVPDPYYPYDEPYVDPENPGEDPQGEQQGEHEQHEQHEQQDEQEHEHNHQND